MAVFQNPDRVKKGFWRMRAVIVPCADFLIAGAQRELDSAITYSVDLDLESGHWDILMSDIGFDVLHS